MQAFLLLSLLAADPEPFTAPKGNAPQLLYASAADGLITVTQTVSVPVIFAEKRVREKDGKKEEYVETVTKTVYESRMVRMDLKAATFSLASGKKLEAAKGLELLAKPRLIVLGEEGKAVDRAYLKVLAPETLVVVPAKSEAPAVGVPFDPTLRPVRPIRPGVRPLPPIIRD